LLRLTSGCAARESTARVEKRGQLVHQRRARCCRANVADGASRVTRDFRQVDRDVRLGQHHAPVTPADGSGRRRCLKLRNRSPR
jgi:hypothetical protein